MNIKSKFASFLAKIRPYVISLIALLTIFGCAFLVYASVTGLWNSLGETVQKWVAGGVAFYVAISVLGVCGSVLFLLGVVFFWTALISWLNK